MVRALQRTHFVDIYFDADWYADLLFALGQDVSSKGQVEETLAYYQEAVSIRKELENDKISQNEANYANLLYFYVIALLSQPLTQDSLNISINSLISSNKLFEAVAESLDVKSLKNYASCCFNLGQIISLYTSSEKELGLSFVREAIDIGERVVNNYGESSFSADVELFRRRYVELQQGMSML